MAGVRMLRAVATAVALMRSASATTSGPQPLTEADMDMLKECVTHRYVMILNEKSGESRSVDGSHGPCAFALVRKFFDGDDEYDDDDVKEIEVPLMSQEAPVTMPMLEAMLVVGKYHLESILGQDPKPPKIPALEKPFLNDTLADAGVPGVVASAIDEFVNEKIMDAMNLLKAADLVEFPELMELAAAKTSLLLRPLFSAKDFDKALDELLPERPGAQVNEHQQEGDTEGDEFDLGKDEEMKDTPVQQTVSS